MAVVTNGTCTHEKSYLDRYLLITNKEDTAKTDSLKHKHKLSFCGRLKRKLSSIYTHIFGNSNKDGSVFSNVDSIKLIYLDKHVNHYIYDSQFYGIHEIDYTGIPDEYQAIAFSTDFFDKIGDYRLYKNRVIFSVLFNKQIIDRLSMIGAICKEDNTGNGYTIFIKEENVDKLADELNNYVINVVPDVFNVLSGSKERLYYDD